MKSLLSIAMIALSLALPCFAQDLQKTMYALYTIDADSDGDGQSERLVVFSPDSPDPTRPGNKELWIYKRLGEKFVPFYQHRFQAAFSNQMAPYQFEYPSTKLGLAVIPSGEGQEYPTIMLVFTPNSEDLAIYRYNGVQYQPEVLED